MAEVIAFPAPPTEEPKPPRHSGRQLWLMKAELRAEHGQGHEAELLDAKIHAVCGHLKRWERTLTGDDRRLDRCKQCPRYREDAAYGRLQSGCYMMAEELVAMAICGDRYTPGEVEGER